MLLQINGIGDQKIKYKDHTNIEFDSLNSYLLLAKKSISKFANKIFAGLSKKMLNDEDAISSIANSIMMADWRWDQNRRGEHGQGKTKYSYRNQCAIWAIQSYVTRQYGKKNKFRQQTVSLDQQYQDDLYIKDIVSNGTISTIDSIIDNEEQNILKKDIEAILDSGILSDRQVAYIKMYFFENMTLEQIGKNFSITREAVRQGLNKAYDTLRSII
jgi:RNA polymerase sigma factor (sigma-70 family)